jgi:hypothetical protein
MDEVVLETLPSCGTTCIKCSALSPQYFELTGSGSVAHTLTHTHTQAHKRTHKMQDFWELGNTTMAVQHQLRKTISLTL